jgi:CubicO group peptidase (beta-lactamase class C family)
MKKNFIALLVLLVMSGTLVKVSGQNADRLPRSIPESEGVSSSAIIDFLNAVDTGRQEIHSFMFLRHGKVIAEGWWNPYGKDYKHILFSASKTFTATAVGLAISENRLKITDKVFTFFPYSMPDSIGSFMRELTVRDLLAMSVGQNPEPRAMGVDGDWISIFLKTEPLVKPGTVFRYNNMATFMLSAIVQQVTGQTVFDYLLPRIFKPLGIRGIDWDKNPQGINLGMIGLRLKTEDLAKFGQLLLQQGVWNHKQLIPKEWVKEATSFKIDSSDPSNKAPKDQNDWAQGYCYQMWRGRNNTVRLDGMGGQFVILIPDKDAIVVLTSNARNTQEEMNLVHNYLIPAIKSDKPVPLNSKVHDELLKRQAGLTLKLEGSKVPGPELAAKISGKEFVLQDNEYQIQSVYLAFSGNECSLALKRNNQISSIGAGLGFWKYTNTNLTSLLAPSRNIPVRSTDANYEVPQTIAKVAAGYSWTDPNTLALTTRYVEESLGSQVVELKFSEMNGSVNITIEPKTPSFFMGPPRPPVQLRGTMVDIK